MLQNYIVIQYSKLIIRNLILVQSKFNQDFVFKCVRNPAECLLKPLCLSGCKHVTIQEWMNQF
jgi:uncharacterized protein YcsI (UPF0317 family)